MYFVQVAVYCPNRLFIPFFHLLGLIWLLHFTFIQQSPFRPCVPPNYSYLLLAIKMKQTSFQSLSLSSFLKHDCMSRIVPCTGTGFFQEMLIPYRRRCIDTNFSVLSKSVRIFSFLGMRIKIFTKAVFDAQLPVYGKLR